MHNARNKLNCAVRVSVVILISTENGKWNMNIHCHFKIQTGALIDFTFLKVVMFFYIVHLMKVTVHL